MIEDYDNAKEEMKRVDHLVFITLKISRNVDVIRNAILRMISACEYLIKDIVVHKKKEMPRTVKERVVLLRKMFKKDERMYDYLDFYELLKRLERAEFSGKDEYRKNVSFVTKFMTVDVPTLEKFFEKCIDFIRYVDEVTGKVHKEK